MRTSIWPLPPVNRRGGPIRSAMASEHRGARKRWGACWGQLLAASTTADPILREVRDCVEQKDWDRLRSSIGVLEHQTILAQPERRLVLWWKSRDPNETTPPANSDFPRRAPWPTGMLDVSSAAWWPKKNRQLIQKAQKCVPCKGIGKNFKPLVPHKSCSAPKISGIQPRDPARFCWTNI